MDLISTALAAQVAKFAIKQFVLSLQYSNSLLKRSDAFFETGNLSIFG
jgi:hypothetical protein